MKITDLMVTALLLVAHLTHAAPALNWQITELPGKNSLRGSAVYGDSLWVTGTHNGVFRSTDEGKSWPIGTGY